MSPCLEDVNLWEIFDLCITLTDAVLYIFFMSFSRSRNLFYFFVSFSRYPVSLCVSSVVDTWEKDIGVHPLDLPQTTCQELLAVLTASTSCLPLSLHSMNSYQVTGPLGNVGIASPFGRRSITLFDSILLLSIIYSLCLVAIVAPIFFKLIFEKRSRGIFLTNYL